MTCLITFLESESASKIDAPESEQQKSQPQPLDNESSPFGMMHNDITLLNS